MLELRFSIYHRAAEVCPQREQASLVDVSLALGIGTIDSGITLFKHAFCR